jgi:hypothetical protein
MKTIQILTAILFLHINLAFAGGPKTILRNPLDPATPKEATFTDSDGLETLMVRENLLRILAPATPAEATFDDQYFPVIPAPDPSELAPETPKEADFSDAEAVPVNEPALSPSTPAAADFEDFI